MTVEHTVGRRKSELPRGELVGRLRRFYYDNPGYYRPTVVAQRLGLSTHQVAMTSRYLMTHGHVERHSITNPNGKTVTIYGLYSVSPEDTSD